MRNGDDRGQISAGAALSTAIVVENDRARHRDSRRHPLRALSVVQHAIIGHMVRLAVMLWIAWAVVVWNVVFDQVIVLAGREYIQAALAASVGPFANMDDWMRPAATRGAWLASGAAGAILLTGVSLCALRRTH